MSIGSAIKQARHARRATQVDLAKALGTHQTAVSDWERDRYRPADETLAAIERQLGLPKGQLLVDAGLVSPEVRYLTSRATVGATAGARVTAEPERALLRDRPGALPADDAARLDAVAKALRRTVTPGLSPEQQAALDALDAVGAALDGERARLIRSWDLDPRDFPRDRDLR